MNQFDKLTIPTIFRGTEKEVLRVLRPIVSTVGSDADWGGLLADQEAGLPTEQTPVIMELPPRGRANLWGFQMALTSLEIQERWLDASSEEAKAHWVRVRDSYISYALQCPWGILSLLAGRGHIAQTWARLDGVPPAMAKAVLRYWDLYNECGKVFVGLVQTPNTLWSIPTNLHKVLHELGFDRDEILELRTEPEKARLSMMKLLGDK